MYASGLSYPSNLPCQKGIIMWSLNAPRWCSSKDNQALVIKKNGNRHNFGFEASTRGKLMFVLGLFVKENHGNSQINYISRLLTALFILSTLFLTPICQRFTPRIAFFLGAACFLYTHTLCFFSPLMLHSCHLW